jgi:hypothetical protein
VKQHTLRGRVDPNATKRLILNDGRLNHGMVVKEFYVWTISLASGDDVDCILSLSGTVTGEMDASDNRQIGWARETTTATTRLMSTSIIDPDHVVVQDLWISNIGTNGAANYLVILEAKELNDNESVLQLIKERSQDDPR